MENINRCYDKVQNIDKNERSFLEILQAEEIQLVKKDTTTKKKKKETERRRENN